jgi:hypothetical protein
LEDQSDATLVLVRLDGKEPDTAVYVSLMDIVAVTGTGWRSTIYFRNRTDLEVSGSPDEVMEKISAAIRERSQQSNIPMPL